MVTFALNLEFARPKLVSALLSLFIFQLWSKRGQFWQWGWVRDFWVLNFWISTLWNPKSKITTYYIHDLQLHKTLSCYIYYNFAAWEDFVLWKMSYIICQLKMFGDNSGTLVLLILAFYFYRIVSNLWQHPILHHAKLSSRSFSVYGLL